MMNKNTAILDNTMMDAYLTVTRATAALSMQALPADLLQFAG